MKQRKLGQDGPMVSAISLGCMSFGGIYGETQHDESFACLDAAWDAGINILDVAEIYGANLCEQIIGDWQKSRKKQFHIATKGGIVMGAERGKTDNTEAGLRKMLTGSSNRLGVDFVDLYYVHRRQFDLPIEEVTLTLAKFVKEGLIGGFGFSEVAPSSLRRAHAVHPVAAIQNEYSLWTRQPELGMLQACRELGTTFVPFSPLGRGILGDHILEPQNFRDTDFRQNQPRFLEPNFSANEAIVKQFREFCADRGWTTAGAAIAWTLDQGDNLIPIPGTRTAAHLLEWADADQISFTDDDRAEIDRIMPAGWAHGDRYSDYQTIGIERYC